MSKTTDLLATLVSNVDHFKGKLDALKAEGIDHLLRTLAEELGDTYLPDAQIRALRAQMEAAASAAASGNQELARARVQTVYATLVEKARIAQLDTVQGAFSFWEGTIKTLAAIASAFGASSVVRVLNSLSAKEKAAAAKPLKPETDTSKLSGFGVETKTEGQEYRAPEVRRRKSNPERD